MTGAGKPIPRMPPIQRQNKGNSSATRNAGSISSGSPRTTNTRWIKRICLLVTTVVPLLALLMNHLPTFTTGDALCLLSRAVFPDAAVQSWSDAYDVVRSADALPFGSLAYNRTMYWGTYRPNVLMGIKGRSDVPLLVGIAWYDAGGAFNVRHAATEDSKIMFRWEAHDGQFFGTQRIVDLENKAEVVVHFVKMPDGRGWDVRVSCHRQSNRPLTFVVYFAHEGGARRFPLTLHANGLHEAAEAQPLDEALGKLMQGGDADPMSFVGVGGHVMTPVAENQKTRTQFIAGVTDTCGLFGANASSTWTPHAFSRPPDSAWNFDMRHTPSPLRSTSALHQASGKHNVAAFKKNFASDFRLHICLRELPSEATPPSQADTPSSDSPAPAAAAAAAAAAAPLALTSCQMTDLVKQHTDRFEDRFHRLFLNAFRDEGIHAGRDNDAGDPVSISNSRRLKFLQKHFQRLSQMATSALSNMIGGMGYWEGRYIAVSKEVDLLSDARGHAVTSLGPGKPHVPVEAETPFPVALFSGVPSRAKFPRGFLWDEGFHQLLMSRWQPEIGKDVMAHWLISASDETSGWIPREQILGQESRSRVPREFTAQHPLHANPPSMVLAIQNFALSTNKSASDRAFLLQILPRLIRWRDWFHATQCGGSPTCADHPRPFPSTTSSPTSSKPNVSAMQYRWRSRNGFHLLACGLDDYPRPICKHHRREMHVDLMSWMALMTNTIRVIEREATSTGDRGAETAVGGGVEAALPWEEMLTRTHWDAEHRRFADVTGCKGQGSGGPNNNAAVPPPAMAFNEHFSPYVGYVSLFPFLAMVVDDIEKALAVLRLARDELNTPFGLASLSLGSRALLQRYQLRHEDYWTGPIWMNINYLFLRALKLKYIDLLGPEAAAFYTTLRLELLENVLKEYMRTDKLWENYHWATGRGQGTAPFTGWTALIVLILAEQY